MKILASVTVACALAVAGAASAQEARIAYGDLDLTTAAGAQAFDIRIQTAARKLCRDARRPGSAIPDQDYCRAAVQTEAVRNLPATSRADYASARRTVEL